ncbi:MAG: insulinase family protein [Alphaproteobacteria bacterium]|nr:insulinase family protein [Alphaproteobacteria bacterium]
MTRILIALVFAFVASFPARAAVDIEEVTSPGGITAWLVQEHTIPFAAIEIRFRGGTALDLPGKRGAINMMTALIEDGSGDMDAQAFARAREELAARISFGAREDSINVSAQFLTENRDASIALLRQALVSPRFDDDAIERVREQILSGIQSDALDPNEIASRTFDRLTFEDHPYGSSPDGTVESVAALTRDDMVEAHRMSLARDRIYVAAVGDITPEELATLLDDLLGDLPETGAPQVADADYLLEPGITVVPFDTPQSVAVFGHEGIDRDDPDFFSAFVANEIFGARGLQSRLMEEIRVKRGLTYGVGAYLALKDRAALIFGQVATANERMAETIEVLRNEWTRIAEEGVTEGELTSAKTYITGAYPLRFDGNAQIAGIMASMQMAGLPIDYIATRNDKIEAVTLADIRRVAARIYRPEDFHVVVVGQPVGLEPSN